MVVGCMHTHGNWHQQSVKAGLDQDIALSVLKPVQVTVALLLIFSLKL